MVQILLLVNTPQKHLDAIIWAAHLDCSKSVNFCIIIINIIIISIIIITIIIIIIYRMRRNCNV